MDPRGGLLLQVLACWCLHVHRPVLQEYAHRSIKIIRTCVHVYICRHKLKLKKLDGEDISQWDALHCTPATRDSATVHPTMASNLSSTGIQAFSCQGHGFYLPVAVNILEEPSH